MCAICGAERHELPHRYSIGLVRVEDEMAQDYIAEEDLFLTPDKETVVKEGDPNAAWLLARAGQTVPADEAERLGLHGGAKPKEEAPAADDDPNLMTEAKSRHAAADKARHTAAEDKGA